MNQPIDELDDLLGRCVADLGATISAGNVLIGDRLGLYRALADHGPLTPGELATRTGTAERYVREWLPGQAAGGYVAHDDGRYWLTEAQVTAFADPDGAGIPGAFELAVSCLADEPRVREAFRTGLGVPWGDHHPGVFTGCERFFRPSYVANLVSAWIPAVPGLHEALSAGIERGGRRLRAGRVDPDPGRDVPGVHGHRVRPAPGVRRARPQGGPRRPGSPRRRTSRAPGTGWSRRSTACTTWATR